MPNGLLAQQTMQSMINRPKNFGTAIITESHLEHVRRFFPWQPDQQIISQSKDCTEVLVIAIGLF